MTYASVLKTVKTYADQATIDTGIKEWKPWEPQTGAQTLTLASDSDEILVGGMAGIGKSALLLIMATTRFRNSIIFRREYPQLEGLIAKSRELMLNSGASYNGSEKIWRGIPGDRTLKFGAMQKEDDKYKYQGREHSLFGFDELVHFTETQFRYVKTWNRSSTGERCKVIATSNPPTDRQGLWVIKYWAPWLDPKHPNPAYPGELRWFVSIDGKDVEVETGDRIEHEGELLIPRSRTYITGTLEQNKYLSNSGYKSALQALPEPLRSQLLKGIWLTFAKDDPWQVIPTEWVKLAIARWKTIPPTYQTHMGVDVARGGADETVIACRHGKWIAPLICIPGAETPDGHTVADQVLLHHLRLAEIRIDVVGVGASPFDILKKLNKDKTRTDRIKIYAMSGGKKSIATDRSGQLGFANQRSEWWWKFREMLDPVNGIDIALPDDEKLLEDLTAPRWWKRSNDTIVVESKEDLAKADRLGRSPDRGDAVVYAFADAHDTAHDIDVMRSLLKG